MTMALIAWSAFVATLSFICYRHPPTSWPVLRQYLRPALVDQPRRNAPETIDENPTNVELKARAETQEDIDRKAMPPPAFKRRSIPSPKSPSPQLTPKASASKPLISPDIPSFSLDDGENEPSAPSFPAANSAQRASGGRNGPPRLNPLPNPVASSNLRTTTNATASLMSPPPRAPLPNRTPNSNVAFSSLAPPPTHNSMPAKPRQKVLLTPGHSPLDWARLTKTPNANLRGLPPSTPFLRVKPSLLKQYNGRKVKSKDGSGVYTTRDAWTSLSGKVYNITPYLPYHPGGEAELLKAAGRDGTKLFGEVHPWVNWEGMLEECLVGFMVEEGEGEVGGGGGMEEMD